MSRSDTRIALKPYLEKITNECSELSKQELTDVILALAKDEPVSRRVIFLQKLRSFLPENSLVEKIVPDVEKAEKIIYEYCKKKYNRHSAFRNEVITVINRSGLLKNIGISW